MPPLRHRLCMVSVLVLHEKLSLTQIRAQRTGHMLRIWKLLWEYVDFHTRIVTAVWLSLLDGLLQMDKTASLESVEVLSLKKMRGCFHTRCPLGCSQLPLIPLTQGGVVPSPVVSAGIRCPQGRVLPVYPKASQNNAKSFLLSPISSCFLASTLRFGVKPFLNASWGAEEAT